MLDIRKRIFLGVGLVLLVILVIIFLLWRKPKAAAPGEIVPPAVDTSQVNTAVPEVTPKIVKEVPAPPPANSLEREKLYVVQLAKIFVERYMSYSNQDENGHITDVETLATTRMVSYIKTQTEAYNRDYKGVSTKVISSKLENFQKDKATVTLGIQQLLEEKDKAGVTSYKNGKMTLLKSEGGWKVDGLFWEE